MVPDEEGPRQAADLVAQLQLTQTGQQLRRFKARSGPGALQAERGIAAQGAKHRILNGLRRSSAEQLEPQLLGHVPRVPHERGPVPEELVRALRRPAGRGGRAPPSRPAPRPARGARRVEGAAPAGRLHHHHAAGPARDDAVAPREMMGQRRRARAGTPRPPRPALRSLCARAAFSGGYSRSRPQPSTATVRPPPSSAPWWAAVSMPRARPETMVAPAAARSRARARARVRPAGVAAREPTMATLRSPSSGLEPCRARRGRAAGRRCCRSRRGEVRLVPARRCGRRARAARRRSSSARRRASPLRSARAGLVAEQVGVRVGVGEDVAERAAAGEDRGPPEGRGREGARASAGRSVAARPPFSFRGRRKGPHCMGDPPPVKVRPLVSAAGHSGVPPPGQTPPPRGRRDGMPVRVGAPRPGEAVAPTLLLASDDS